MDVAQALRQVRVHYTRSRHKRAHFMNCVWYLCHELVKELLEAFRVALNDSVAEHAHVELGTI